MVKSPVLRIRLINQQISDTKFKSAAELVKWFGPVQAQDYNQAKWAIGVRIPGITDPDIDLAFNKGQILRTHILRPTWHFVSPDDIRWILKLTAPRIDAACAGIFRRLELDKKIFSKSNAVLEKCLENGKHLTRDEIGSVFAKQKISVKGLRFIYLLFRAELDGIICSGGKTGNQFTYALLEKRSKKTERFSERDEALAELTRRYFTSHGPATIQDFSWWSGLTITDAKCGVNMIKPVKLNAVTYFDKMYCMAVSKDIGFGKHKSFIKLLPAFDEYTVAYRDRSDVIEMAHYKRSGQGIFSPLIISDGKIIGNWKRSIVKDKLIVELHPFVPLNRSQKNTIDKEIKRYAEFLGREL